MCMEAGVHSVRTPSGQVPDGAEGILQNTSYPSLAERIERQWGSFNLESLHEGTHLTRPDHS